MSVANQIYGLASTAIYVRSQKKAPSSTLSLLQNLSRAFGGSTSDGTYIYNLFKADLNLLSTLGFDDGGEWEHLESLISGNQASKIGIAALIYAFSTYSNIELQYQQIYINKLYSNIYNGTPPSSFTEDQIINITDQFSLATFNSEISVSPANAILKTVNYNWYDSYDLFSHPESNTELAKLIKDAENQYYYISGEISYTGLSISNPTCIKDSVTINTPTGQIITTVYRTLPCFDQDSYVGPVTGIKFFRTFNDGPATSGYFYSDVSEAYIGFDNAIANNNRDFSSNNRVIYSYLLNDSGNFISLKSGAQIDGVGAISASGEYGYGHTHIFTDDGVCHWSQDDLTSTANTYFLWKDYSGVGLPLMRMHQGDNQSKWNLYKYCPGTATNNQCDSDCAYTGTLNSWTGWKFVNLELNDSWASHFSHINTNPKLDTGRVLKRALNLENYLYQSGTYQQAHTPYLNVTDNEDGSLTCFDYVGQPQLSNYSTLPGFAFYQTFDSNNFGTGSLKDFASVNIRPSISTSSSAGLNKTSIRDIQVSEYNIFSGKNASHDTLSNINPINIDTEFNSSGMSTYDDVFRKCLSIGDNFSNQVSSTANLQSNAGFIYTGYTYSSGGVSISQYDLLAQYSGYKNAAKYSIVNYISGYKRLSDNKTFGISTQYAQIITGDSSTGVFSTGEQIRYYYFNTNSGIGAYNIEWGGNFAPLPDDVFTNGYNYSGIYSSQKVENYLPRYSRGPFATYNVNFLYPNAQYAFSIYNARTNGFPYKYSYVINVKEETVREFYLLSGLGGDKINQKIIRADVSYNPTGLKTEMVVPFTPNDSAYKNTYNFYKNTSLYPPEGAFFYQAILPNDSVNAFYVPSTDYCTQLHLNSKKYRYYPSTTFKNGVRITGEYTTRKIYTGVSGLYKTIINIQTNGGGFYWGYQGIKLSGEMLYTPPIFDLSTSSLNVNTQMQESLFTNKIGSTYSNFSNNGSIRNMGLVDGAGGYNGRDPIFYEYVGGRSGNGSNLEGGYHSKGIIGDKWLNFQSDTWGTTFKYCGDGKSVVRWPLLDKNLFLLSLDSGNLDIFTRGLFYNPYYLDWKYQPFTSPTISPIGVTVTARKVNSNPEYYYDFNLKNNFYPLQSGVSSGPFSGLYSTGGLNIGPFDRDVEFCVFKNNSIVPSGDFIVDGEALSKSGYAAGGCSETLIEGFILNSGIVPGQGERNENLTTFKLIPSGGTVNINISGYGAIGINNNAIVSIRPRTIFGAVDSNSYYSMPYLSGDASMMDSFRFINNNTEKKFSFSLGGNFENLIGQKFEYTTTPRTETLFPVPDPADFDTILSAAGKLTLDIYGNKTYSSTKGPTYDYWKIKNPNLYASGIREVSRISFEIISINASYGGIPFQSYLNIIPSGSCRISGVFSYTGQAESAILSQGLLLSGYSGASALSAILDPIYISDVLHRLPTGIETLPSGSGIHPISDAPSYMKKRKNYFSITGGDSYINYSPSASLNYNKFLWPALSDLAILNPELVYETLPPDDGSVFLNSYLTLSASQGQILSSGINAKINPEENVTYKVKYEYGFIDSTATNSSYNTGKCIIKGVGLKETLNSGDLTGILAGENATISMSLNF